MVSNARLQISIVRLVIENSNTRFQWIIPKNVKYGKMTVTEHNIYNIDNDHLKGVK